MNKKDVKIVNGVQCVSLSEEELYKMYLKARKKHVNKGLLLNTLLLGKNAIFLHAMREFPSFEEWQKAVVQRVKRVQDDGTEEVLYNKVKDKQWWEESDG